MPDQQFVVFHPEQKVFQNIIQQSRVIGTPTVYQYESTEYPENGGILIYYKGLKMPVKGFPYPEAIQAINIVKQAFIRVINALASSATRPFTIFLSLLPFKNKALDACLHQFNEFSLEILKPHVLQKQFMTEIACELQTFITTFLSELGLKEAERFAIMFSTLIEYDNAYRFRLQDILSETTPEKLITKPSQEITRLLLIYLEREKGETIKPKFHNIAFLFRVAFFIPSIKKAFKKAIFHCYFPHFTYDDIDRASVLNRGDYNFLGKPLEERQKMFSDLQEGSLPQQFILHD